jgi:pimeloyl-ACP methyl ester carboxylesterase
MFPAGRPELRTRYLELKSELRVRAVECGEDGAPVILFLPGWGCSAYVFRENFVPLAAAGFHVVAVDLKGHGLSDKPQSPEEYRLGAMRQHVVEIMDAIGGSSFLLAGMSMGSALGAYVAAERPDRVRGVVMVSPVGFSGVPGLGLIRFATPQAVTRQLPRIASRKVIELILFIVNGKLRHITEEDIEEYWAPTQFPEFTRAMRHLLHEFTWRARFVALRVPCLVITGERDRLVSAGAVKAYCGAVASIRHIEVPQAGHVIYDEAAHVVNDAIADFFRKTMDEAYIQKPMTGATG